MAASASRGRSDLFEWRIADDGFAPTTLQGCLRAGFDSQTRTSVRRAIAPNEAEFDRETAVIIAARSILSQTGDSRRRLTAMPGAQLLAPILEADGDAGVTVQARRRFDPASKDARVILFIGQIGDPGEKPAMLGNVILGREIDREISGDFCRHEHQSGRIGGGQIRVLEESMRL